MPAPAGAPLGGRRSRLSRLIDLLLGKALTLVLAAVAVALGIATFSAIARGAPQPGLLFSLVLASTAVGLLLVAVLAARLTRVWAERRRGSAGSRLHVRLVLLFSGVAVTPAIVVAVFATFFFHLGIQDWFNEPVRTTLEESLKAARGYLDEHRNNIRIDALGMANDLLRASGLMGNDLGNFVRVLSAQAALRGLTEAVVYEPVTGHVMASVGPPREPPPTWATELARSGDVAVLNSADSTRVRAVVQLDLTPPLMLVIGRSVDPEILNYVRGTEQAVAEYHRLDDSRTGLQLTFAMIFALIALLVLAAAGLIGMVIANQIVRPIGGLIAAAERVRSGDLSVQVAEVASGDEVASLARAFNRMTGQLAAQRSELMDAYSQLDARRRFTEAVLSGVSAGVIGLDASGRVELPNHAASALLGIDLLAALGHDLAAVAPAFGPLLAQAREAPELAHTGEVQAGPPAHRRTLLVRISADRATPAEREAEERPRGFVATFDDITELQSAQRKAAWADVARRIAHEIKNPLTPIQLAAERLKRRFAREITSDPETFTQCADTIVRHVGDIGRMVDEFSAFARMPNPVIKEEDIGRLVREALVLPRNAHPEYTWEATLPERGPVAPCDRRLLGQALTNLLRNAGDAVAMRPRAPGEPAGHIAVAIATDENWVQIHVTDDGVGLPDQDRERLTEPYVTHKPKGTGLGLAIVKKIMEDHGGRVTLEDRSDGPGAVVTLTLPLRQDGRESDGT